jgi:2-deoxy-D-gluconate 3-dehydrogenase
MHTGNADRFHPISADLGDRSSTLAVIEEIRDEFGTPHVLINNAGAATREQAIDYPMEDWDRLLELNVTAPFLLARGFAPGMIERGSGKVIFTASLWSFLGGWQVPAYTVTKSAVAGMIRALSNEWAPLGIQVTGIAPGYIETDLTRPVIEDPERAPKYLARIPAGRFGQPSDLVGAALFLASPLSDYISGVILPVDGGWLAH